MSLETIIDCPEIDISDVVLTTKNQTGIAVNNTRIPYYINHDWIPVSKPPKKNGWYLVYAETYGKFGPNPNHEGVMFSRWNGEIWTANRRHCITHWMRIPTKPYVYLEDIKR